MIKTRDRLIAATANIAHIADEIAAYADKPEVTISFKKFEDYRRFADTVRADPDMFNQPGLDGKWLICGIIVAIEHDTDGR